MAETQVTVEYKKVDGARIPQRVHTILISTQHAMSVPALDMLVMHVQVLKRKCATQSAVLISHNMINMTHQSLSDLVCRQGNSRHFATAKSRFENANCLLVCTAWTSIKYLHSALQPQSEHTRAWCRMFSKCTTVIIYYTKQHPEGAPECLTKCKAGLHEAHEESYIHVATVRDVSSIVLSYIALLACKGIKYLHINAVLVTKGCMLPHVMNADTKTSIMQDATLHMSVEAMT